MVLIRWIRFGILAFLLLGCTNKEAQTNGETSKGLSQDSANVPATEFRAMPFTIKDVSLSDLYENNLKVGTVNVKVSGGTEGQWIATAIAIASTVSDLGADSVEATVDRSDLEGIKGVEPHYLHLARVYYSKNPARSVWKNNKQIEVVTPYHLATPTEVRRDTEFKALNEQLISQGMNAESADKKAGEMIAAKYHQPKEWKLSTDYLTEKELPSGDMNIISADAKESLALLTSCMQGKIIRVFQSCQ